MTMPTMSDLIVDFPARSIVSKKKSVQFSSMSTMIIVDRIDKKDTSNMWYTSTDYKAMRAANKQSVQDALKTAHTMRSLSSIVESQDATEDELETCTMLVGIESMLTLTAIKKTRASRAHLMASVLQEQERQGRSGVCDADRLAFVAQHCSRSAARRAHSIGKLHSL